MSNDLQERVALLPCPFCGGKAVDDTHSRRTGCPSCGIWVHRTTITAESEIGRSVEREAVAWNTRSDAALAEIGGVRVKPLEWEDYPINGEPVLSMAVTPIGTYFICDDVDDFSGLYCEFVSYKDATWHGTVKPLNTVICDRQHVDDDATLKAAAQADYEARILAAIEPAPVSVREAARVLLDDVRIEPVHDAIQRSVRPSAFCAALRAIAEGKDDE